MEQPNRACHIHRVEMEKRGLTESTLFTSEGKALPCWVYSCSTCRDEKRTDDHQFVLLGHV
jgi:hypothetical protein